MARYALVAPDDTIYTEKAEERIDLTAGVRDGYRWLPIVNEVNDTTTQQEYVVTEPVVETIEVARVLRSRTRRDMTAQEIADRKAELVLSDSDTVIAKGLFKLANDFRVSQGQAELTVAQFRSWLEAQL